MSTNEISSVIKQICEEKNISYESVIDTIEQALSAAYRKDFGQKNQNIKCEFNPETGKTRVFDVKTVVEDLPEEELEAGLGQELKVKSDEQGKEIKKQSDEKSNEKKDKGKAKDESEKDDSKKDKIKAKKEGEAGEPIESEEEKPKFNPKTDLQLSDAKKIKKTAKIGDEIITKLEIPNEFGRMAAQTAKQVIIQRLREAERNTLFNEYKEKEGQVITGIIQRQEGRLVLVDLGNATAILPPDQQVENDNYGSGQRYRFYISQVRETSKGPEIVVSRAHPEIVKQLFAFEVPEIASGTVEIKSISREAGSRSKVAVATNDDSIDPIGSCVGQRGTRIQTIINEIGGEKLDIIEYSDNSAKFISNALSPAKVVSVELNEKEKAATVKVRADQISLAIGKVGQNVRLAAKLTGWKIDIKEAEAPGTKLDEKKKEEEKSKERDDKEKPKEESKKELKEEAKKEKPEKKEAKKKDKEEDKENIVKTRLGASQENETKPKKESKEKKDDKDKDKVNKLEENIGEKKDEKK